MRLVIAFAIAATSTLTAHADSYSDMAQFAQSICADIPEGSLGRTAIQGKVEANAGLFAKIVSGGANVSGTKTEEIYKGIPFDRLPDKIPTVSMCKLELVKVLLGQQHGTVIQNTNGTNSPAQSGSGNTVIINGKQ